MKIETETAIVPFDFNGAQIRVIRDDKGEPWFVAKDVATVLGYVDTINAIKAHCKGVVKRHLPTSGGLQSMSTIPERDLYRLVIHSRLPEAEAFEEWVVGTVLPSIRKHGAYITPTKLSELLSDPGATRQLLTALVDEQERRLEAERVVAEKQQVIEAQAPKVERYDAFLDAEKGITVDKAAKAMSKKLGIDIGQKRLFKFLRLYKFLRQNNSPYQQYIERGLFTTCLVKIRNGAVVAQTLITPKGFDRIVTDFMDFMENGPKAKYVI